jgi:hypothetical protein
MNQENQEKGNNQKQENNDSKNMLFASIKTDPSIPLLTKDQGDVAVKDLLNSNFTKLEYPKVTRLGIDPPLPGNQNLGLVTFIPSREAKPDKHGIYGIMKVRGTFATDKEASDWANKLIREVDSMNAINYIYPGRYFPVTNEDKFCENVDEVKLKEYTKNIVLDDYKEKKALEENEIKLVEDRKKDLLEPTDSVKDRVIDQLEVYTQLRVKRATLRQYQEELEKKQKEITSLIRKHTTEMGDLEEKHPTYATEFKKKYFNELSKIGVSEGNNTLLKYL